MGWPLAVLLSPGEIWFLALVLVTLAGLVALVCREPCREVFSLKHEAKILRHILLSVFLLLLLFSVLDSDGGSSTAGTKPWPYFTASALLAWVLIKLMREK